jgi:hypothetical protein
MPLIEFVIGGAQKGGTSALAQYLRNQPGTALPEGKEAHVFDRPDFDESWSPARIDREYAPHFGPSAASQVHGDATPIYLFHPRLVRRIARYNPAMKWLVLLRDPVDRAISQYHMERSRGHERLPLWAALLAEPLRLMGRGDDFSHGAALRHHSYVARGRYLRQLDYLYQHFPRDQVLVMRSSDLLADPAACVTRACRMLGVADPDPGSVYLPVFTGQYDKQGEHRLERWALRQLFRPELAFLNGGSAAQPAAD